MPTSCGREAPARLGDRGLTGGVFALVGEATHYHTDAVLPKWGWQMDKILGFHGHLFYRWRGPWGRPSAFRGTYGEPEILDPRLLKFAETRNLTDDIPTDAIAAIPDAVVPGAPPAAPVIDVAGLGKVAATGSVRVADDVRHVYYVYFGGDDYPGSYAITAWKICAGKSPCTVHGWRTLAEIPATATGAIPASVSFSFTKGDDGRQTSLWNCRQVARDNPHQCLPNTQTTP